MKTLLFYAVLTTILAILPCATNLNAQTVLATQSFETTPATQNWTYTSTGGTVSTNTGAADFPANQRIRSGSRSYQVNNGTGTLNFDPITGIAANSTGLRVVIHLSSTSLTSGNGADAADTVRVFTALNGGAFPATPDITIQGNTNARWGYNETVNAQTTAGTPVTFVASPGTNSGTIYSTLVINIPDGTTSVALRIIALNNDGNEVWNIDDVTLFAIAPTAASVSVAGKVLGAKNRPVIGARVSLTDQNGMMRTALTNAFGFYRFDDVSAGETYVFNVSAKRYTFQPMVVTVTEEIRSLDFTSEP